jgi:hypothetical protein
MVLAAFPEWLSENLSLFSVLTLAALALLVMRLVQKTMTRGLLLALLVAAAFFVYANEAQIERCANTCECRLLRQNIEIPTCNPRFPGD